MAKAEDVVIKIRTDDGQLTGGLKTAEKKLGDFADTGRKLGGALAGIFAAERIGAFTRELILLGGQADGVRAAFDRIADSDAMDRLKAATAGTVSELELMKRAVSANNLGIPVADLANLFEFATKRAQETGQSVDYLVDSIVMGIGRKSPLILDNLGISAIQLREKLKGVSVEAASVADISAAVGRIAAESMEESGGVIQENSIKVQQLTAQWEDLKLSIADDENFKALASGGIGLLNNTLQALSYTIDAFKTKGISLIDIAGGVNAQTVAAIVARKIEEENKKRQASIKHIDEETNAYRNNIAAEQNAAETKQRHGRTIDEIKQANEDLKKTLGSLGEFQTAERVRTLQQIEANEKLIKSLTSLKVARTKAPDMGGTMSTRTDLPTIKTAPGLWDDVQNLELDKLTEHNEAWTERYKELMQERQDEVDEINAAFQASLVEGLAGGIEAAFAGKGIEGVMIAFLKIGRAHV